VQYERNLVKCPRLKNVTLFSPMYGHTCTLPWTPARQKNNLVLGSHCTFVLKASIPEHLNFLSGDLWGNYMTYSNNKKYLDILSSWVMLKRRIFHIEIR
jgi:hypothetical protein